MEENHQDISWLFYSSDTQNSHVVIPISSVQENIEKLYEASKMGSVQTLKTLIHEDPYLIQKALIYTSSLTVETPLLHVSVSHGYLQFTRLLLDHSPQLAAEVDAFQRTPLHIACANGDMEMVGALLEKNTSACLVEDHNGFIPLHHAVMSGKIEMMELLIKARPQSVLKKLNNNNGKTVLHLCVEGNHLEEMKLLIPQVLLFDKDFVNTLDDAGNTILDLSLMLRQIEMVGYLLTIPEVKTRTNMTEFSPSNSSRKERVESRKMRKMRNVKRQRGESISSLGTKKPIGWWKVWRKKMMYKGDWVQEVQGTMMLVATVIATVTFQGGVNPPGGVWQQDTQFNYSSFSNSTYRWDRGFDNPYSELGFNNDTIVFAAGTAVMSYQQQQMYWIYLWVNTVSFLASMSVILMIVGRFPLKNKICSWLLALAMCIAVVSLAIGYLLGVKMVNLLPLPDSFPANYDVLYLTVMCWFGVVVLVCLWHLLVCLWRLLLCLWCVLVCFPIWMVKTLFCTFTSNRHTASERVFTL